ncbi:MAG: GTPase [Candidatus Pacearchaeota archaeon]
MANSMGRARKSRGKNPGTHKHKSYVLPIIDRLIEEADIILEVLDSRFIEKTRNLIIEKKVRGLKKPLIYVFNKADLIDVNKVRSSVELEKLHPSVFVSSKNKDGFSNLRTIIKMEAKKFKQDSINVGVVGYPNTGKSSLINVFTGRGSVKTSSEAGYTKGIQKIKLSKGLYLVDTPGVIPFLEKISTKEKDLVKHSQIGATTWDKAKNPDFIVDKIIKEYPGALEKYYGIDSEKDSEDFIEKLGKKLNYYKKKNLIDETRTAKKILRDWQEGKIKLLDIGNFK